MAGGERAVGRKRKAAKDGYLSRACQPGSTAKHRSSWLVSFGVSSTQASGSELG